MSPDRHETKQYAKSYALVVGVGTYKSKRIKDVPATANEAREIVRLLKDPEYCALDPDRVIGPLTDGEAVKIRILEELDNLLEKAVKGFQATVLLYFAGHGVVQDKEYFFLSHDSKAALDDDGKPTSSANAELDVSHSALLEKFRKIQALSMVKRLVIVFNTCQSHGLLGTSLSGDQSQLSNARAVPSSLYEELLQGEGTCFIAASKTHQNSWIPPNATYSLFGEKFINALKGAANAVYDKKLTIRDLTFYLAKEVQRESKDQQIVSIDMRGSDVDFPIALLRGGKGEALLSLQLFMARELLPEDQRFVASLANIDVIGIAENDPMTIPARVIDYYYNRKKMGDLEDILLEVVREAAECYFSQHEILNSNELIRHESERREAKRREKIIQPILDTYYAEKESYDGVDVSGLILKCRSALRALDLTGKNELLFFLHEADLLGAVTHNLLTGLDLSEVNMQGFCLADTNLHNVKLCQAKLGRCNLQNANIREADLRGADFEGADISNAKFIQSDLQGAVFNDAKLEETNFREAKLQNASFFGHKTRLLHTNFEESHLEGANFDQAQIKFINLKESFVDKDTKLDSKWLLVRDLQTDPSSDIGREETICDADLSNTNLNTVHFDNATLIDVNFTGASLLDACFKEANLINCTFSNARLMQANNYRKTWETIRGWTARIRGREVVPISYQKQPWGVSREADFQDALSLGADFEGAFMLDEQLDSALPAIETTIPMGKKVKPFTFQFIQNEDDIPQAPDLLMVSGQDTLSVTDPQTWPEFPWIVGRYDFVVSPSLTRSTGDGYEERTVSNNMMGSMSLNWPVDQEFPRQAKVIESISQFRERIKRIRI